MDQQEVTADFLKNELQTGITFADLALSARHDDRRERNKANARKAYDTALRFMGTLSPTPEINAEFKDLLEHLRAQLKELGESILSDSKAGGSPGLGFGNLRIYSGEQS